MSYAFRFGAGFAMAAALAFQVGCDSGENAAPVAVSDAPPAGGDDHDHDHDHDHAATGPHGGDLVEFGSGDYHGEVVHNEAEKSIEVFILDGSAEAPAPVNAPSVMINISHEGEPMQFELAALPTAEDTAPLSSRYSSTDATLIEELDHAHGDATLVLTIEGKQYRGTIAHDHGHEGHDHDHEGHDH